MGETYQMRDKAASGSALAFAARLVARAHGKDRQQGEGDDQGGCLDDDLHGINIPSFA
jgi:hypothetical protein